MDVTSSFLLLPGSCLLCGRDSLRQRDLCIECERELPCAGASCHLCAMPLRETDGRRATCGNCLRKPPPQSFTLAAFRYDWPLNTLVQRFKFTGDHACGRVLGELFAQQLAVRGPAKPDCLVPVPLHASRLRERGFNQSTELARFLSRDMGVLLHDGLLIRTRATEEQSGKNAVERRRNLKGAFMCSNTANLPANVVLIDDVMTTGTTASEAARTLKAAGVHDVAVWTLARTP